MFNLSGTDDASRQALADASGAVHRGVLADRSGRHRQAGHARQGERPGRSVLRAGGAPRWAWIRDRTESIAGQKSAESSPRTGGSSSRAARSRPRPCPRHARPTTTPAAGWPDVRCRRAGTRAVVEAGTGRRGLGSGLGAAVRRDVLGHERRGLRRIGLRKRLRDRLRLRVRRGIRPGHGRRRGGRGGFDGGGFDGGGFDDFTGFDGF